MNIIHFIVSFDHLRRQPIKHSDRNLRQGHLGNQNQNNPEKNDKSSQIVKFESSKPQELNRFPHFKSQENYETQLKFNDKLTSLPFSNVRKADINHKRELTSSAIPFSTTPRSPQPSVISTIPTKEKFKTLSSDGFKALNVKSDGGKHCLSHIPF